MSAKCLCRCCLSPAANVQAANLLWSLCRGNEPRRRESRRCSFQMSISLIRNEEATADFKDPKIGCFSFPFAAVRINTKLVIHVETQIASFEFSSVLK